MTIKISARDLVALPAADGCRPETAPKLFQRQHQLPETADKTGIPDISLYCPGQRVHRIVADQPARPADLVHDLIAGVDTGGAADALELQPVADVDAGRADLHAALAVDTVAFGLAFRAARFAAFDIIADDDGVLVGQGALQSAVGAHDDAELFAEPAEAEPQGKGQHGNDSEGTGVGQRALQSVFEENG